MQIDEIKNILIKLYQKSLYVTDADVEKHPVRLIESCKSLIGINRLSPNQKLIKFAEDYSSKFKLKEIEFDANELSTPPVVGFLDLELSLLDSCIEDSFKNAYYLTKVSDGKQILEFLLEFSIKYGTNTFLLILSIIRMEMFIGFKNVLPSLLVCIKYIILDTNKRKVECKECLNGMLSKYVILEKDLNLFLNLYRLDGEDLVRKNKISPYLFNSMQLNCKLKKGLIKINVLEEQHNYRRMWISEYLDNLDYDKYNLNTLLDLDAFRACFKMLKSTNEEKILWSYLNESL